MFPLVNINRGLWKQKPHPWGNHADVSGNLKDRLEAIGITYDDCVLGMPLFNPGDQLDYSKNGFEFINNGAIFNKNAFDFDGSAIPFSLSDKPTVTYPFTLIAEVSIADVANAYGFCNFGSSGSEYGGIFFNTGATNDTIVLSASTTAGAASNHRRTFASTANASDQYVNNLGMIVVVVRNNSTCEMYCNGVDEFSAITGTYLSNPVFGDNSYIGDRYTDNNHLYLNGSIGQVMLLDTGISEDQALSLSDNKWQLWQPKTYTYYSFPIGAITIEGIISESLSLSDISSNNAIFSASITETLNMQDTDSNNAIFDTIIDESLNISDTYTSLIKIVGNIAESLSISDTIVSNAILRPTIEENISITDTFLNILLAQGIINESLSLLDTSSSEVTLRPIINENLNINDSLISRVDLISQINETINISDSITLGAIINAIISESINFSDTILNNLLLIVEIAESIILTDESTVQATFNVEINDTLQFIDVISNIAILKASISEVLGISDIISETSLLPNGKVSISFTVKTPNITESLKIPEVSGNIKKATIIFNLK